MVDDFGFEIEHQFSYLYICQSNNKIIRNIYSYKKKIHFIISSYFKEWTAKKDFGCVL